MDRYRTGPRLNPRIETRIGVALFPAGEAADPIMMATVNLSAGGALCVSDRAVPAGRSVKVRLDLVDAAGALQPVVLEAIVLRVSRSAPFEVALHFVDVPPRVDDLVKRYVIRVMREGS